MSDIEDHTLAQIDAAVPGTIWEILPGVGAPRQPICGKYASATKGVAALRKAGFRISTQAVVPAQTLGESYDSRTVMPWTFKNVFGVEIGLVLVARVKGEQRAAKRPRAGR